MTALLLITLVQVVLAIGLVLIVGRLTRGRRTALIIVAGTFGPWVVTAGLGFVTLLLLPRGARFGAGEGLAAIVFFSMVVIPVNALAAVATWGNRQERWSRER